MTRERGSGRGGEAEDLKDGTDTKRVLYALHPSVVATITAKKKAKDSEVLLIDFYTYT